MQKLNKKQQKRRTELVAALQTEADNIQTAYAAYNAVLGEAREFVEEIVGAIDDYTGERSEAWHEGDKATAIADWKEQWEGLELDDLEDFESAVEALDEVPVEAEG